MKKLTIQILLTAIACMACIFACKEDEMFPETRLFRPVLNEDLRSEGNAIIIDMAKLKNVSTYTVEVSRDTFKTIDYTLELDTNYVVLNDEFLDGDPLFWNMLYQVRATAHHKTDSELDSRISDLGSVRTERFPSILNGPKSYDVIDIAARVTWAVENAPVTKIKVFAGSDLKLFTPLFEVDVPQENQESGEIILEELDPSTKYQVAIYSDDVLRGWVDYTTLVADIDPAGPGVVDIRTNESPTAVADAVAAAADGAIILVKRGVFYDLPTVALNKSITIRAAYGFGKQKARLFTTGNWNIAGASTIDHIRFIDLELRGEDYAGDYVFNPSVDNVFVGEVLFDNCELKRFRGIMRIRNTNVVIDNYKIINCAVDSLGGYGIITTDTPPNATNPTARVNNIVLQNSTFNRVQMGISSQNSSESIQIDGCTFSNFVQGSNFIFRYRGGVGFNDVTNGISIKNSIFGPVWDPANTKVYTIRGKDGLPNTLFDIVNTYSTSEVSFVVGFEIAGFPVANYSGKQTDLWVDPLNTGNFNFKDAGFAGKYSTGDPRWRAKL